MSGIFKTPLRFAPIFKEKIWGGNALREKLLKNAPADRRIGESWEISGWGDSQSRVIDGEFAGQTLSELFDRDPQGLVGEKWRALPSFPLLFKFIDAQDDLSIQVHPNGLQAQTKGWGKRGKTEAWYIVDAKPGAHIALGFNHSGITPQMVSDAVKKGTLESYMNIIPVKTGDTFFIPAGTVHAILGGLLIYEMQEESNTTLRLYDWNRKDQTGAPRELHVEDALSVINFDERRPLKPEPLTLADTDVYKYETLCDNSKFTLNRCTFKKHGIATPTTTDVLKVITIVSGAATLHHDTGAERLYKGDTILLPANLPNVKLEGNAGTEALSTRPQRPDWAGRSPARV